MPPLGEFSKNLGEVIEYNGTENIIKAINYYNDKCFLIYGSTTSLYDTSLSGEVSEKIKEEELTNYTIFRLPLILNDISHEPFMYNIKKNLLVEVTTKEDAAYAFVKAIPYQKELNKKTFLTS